MRSLEKTMRVCKWLMITLGIVAVVTAALGQVPMAKGTLPAFEVATVRPSAGESVRGGQWRRQDERFVMRYVTLQEMVMFAYGLGNANEIAGTSGWMRSERFDIEGKLTDADTKATSALSQDDWDGQMRLRMQQLLAERFHLQVSFEKKELPVYVVSVAKGGFQCKATTGASGGPGAGAPHFFNPIPPPQPQQAGGPSVPSVPSVPMMWRIRGWSFSYLLRMLASAPEAGGRVMVDRSGLRGNYDCDLGWAPASGDAAGPSLFTAVQEQLGLKLTPGKEPVEIVNVVSAAQPTEN